MTILYHTTALPPKLPGTEAVAQEITALCSHFGGDVVYINPNANSPVFVPRLLFGFSQLRRIRSLEENVDLHHIYNPDPFPFPVLRLLHRPVVYSLTCGVKPHRPPLAFLRSLSAVVASDDRSYQFLQAWGLQNVHLAHPGIDTARFTFTPQPMDLQLRLMVGSAPWSAGQFQTKGVDILLETLRRNPNLYLVFLWRGILAQKMYDRIRRAGVADQIEVIDEQVNVNRVLARVHGSILLTTDTSILKSYPHSLLESLVAGKPVILTRSIPMADFVERVGCGCVVEQATINNVMLALESFCDSYQELQASALEVGRHHFTQQRMVDSFRHVYESVLDAPG